MTSKVINAYLVAAILTLSVVPLIASYFLLDEVLDSAIGLAIKPSTEQLLQAYRDDLKVLKTLDAANQDQYKARFLAASEALNIYTQPQLLRQVLTDTYLTYYLLLFMVFLLLSLLGAILLSRKVARAYKALAQKDIAKAQKIQELQYFDQWQLIAGKLAHEINNPLTPIEMMVSNLPRSYANADSQTFATTLADTKAVVSEEVHKLKAMVSHFSQFSKLPEPVLKPINLVDYCTDFIAGHQTAWPNIQLQQQIEGSIDHRWVQLDHLLFNQCLFNMINNAIQANPALCQNQQLSVTLTLRQSTNPDADSHISLTVFNNGKAIDANSRQSLFKLYYSSKAHSENSGLGLSIVRKIILDHGGDVHCLALDEGAAFEINLPVSAQNKSNLPDDCS